MGLLSVYDTLPSTCRLCVCYLYGNIEVRVCVESDGSKKLKADFPVGSTYSLFRESPASGMAEKETVGVYNLNFRIVSGTARHESQFQLGG